MSRFQHVLDEARAIAEGRTLMLADDGHLAVALLAYDDANAKAKVYRAALLQLLGADAIDRLEALANNPLEAVHHTAGV